MLLIHLWCLCLSDIQQLLPIKEELDEWSPDMEQQVQLLSIKKEEEEEADITDFPLAAAAAVKSENEEKVHSLFHHVKNEYKDEEEPQTSSSGKKNYETAPTFCLCEESGFIFCLLLLWLC